MSVPVRFIGEKNLGLTCEILMPNHYHPKRDISVP